MIECREVVDTVKQDAALANTSTDIPKNIVVLDKDGKVCDVCTELQAEFAKNPGGVPPRNAGLVLAGLVGGAGLAITTICVPFVVPALRAVCLPYVPATTAQLANVSKALGVVRTATHPHPTLVDIGSGDGRIVLQAAREGYKAHGVELNRWLVYYSRWNAWRTGLRGQATFARQDLWKSDMSKFNNVVIFGVEQMMSQLESKLEKELVKGSVVVACRFKFPTWKPVQEIGVGVDTVWKYQR